MKDLLRIYLEAAVNENLSGPVSLCAESCPFPGLIKTLIQSKNPLPYLFLPGYLKFFYRKLGLVFNSVKG